ncbi:MAG: phenylalanine--tRNA ligase subunit beta [Clostridiaceae bacterium]|jgi:phenylalanyl-tRNA synthetase beta chain|nr:phenylalanine--tRNA ligase subunit beta [Clostridiaceae bacterium]
MKVSLNWIREYVDLPEDLSPEKLAYELTMRTVEVEDITNPADLVNGIIVGRIEKVLPHPNAELLRVCHVDCGLDKTKQIVCGGINLYDGEVVAVAPPGAEVIWHGEGEPVVLKATKLRGVLSEGMICSSTEINLGELFPLSEEAEILDLTPLFPDAEPGITLASLLDLDDVILEIDNKSMTNRPDLWGHYGIARELAAIFGGTLRQLPSFAPPKGVPNYPVEILDPDRCDRYDATLFEGVTPEKAPFWMQRAIWSVGMRPHNVLVDITNYVMLALGQPLHGFDQDHVEDGIRVRTAHQDETLELLDESVLHLADTDLLICDGHDKPIGLAGIMGGARDSILPETTNMLLEVAHFDAQTIRKTVMHHHLRTEASNRFEKAIDTQRCDQALGLAQYLMMTLQPNAKIVAYGTAQTGQTEKLTIDVPLDFLCVRSGSKLTADDVRNTLESLGFEVKIDRRVSDKHIKDDADQEAFVKESLSKDANMEHCKAEKDGNQDAHDRCKELGLGANQNEMKDKHDDVVLQVTVPTWRATGDISMRDDILEEVCRMIGYHHIEYQPPVITLEKPVRQLRLDRLRAMKEYLAFRADLQEIFTYPWVSDAFLKAADGEDALTAKSYVTLATPPAPDRSRLRRSLIPVLLDAVVNNLRYYESFGLFNTETVFLPCENKASDASSSQSEHMPLQRKHLGIALAGDDAVNLFLRLKGILEDLPRYSGVEPFLLVEGKEQPAWADRHAWMVITDQNNNVIGTMGLLAPMAASRAGIKQSVVALAELNLDDLVPLPSRENQFEALPYFPLVEQDLSMIVDREVTWGDIEEAIGKSVKKLEFIEEYHGEQVPEGKKSLMFRFWLGSDEGTMTPDQIEKARSRVIKKLTYTLGAKMR